MCSEAWALLQQDAANAQYLTDRALVVLKALYTSAVVTYARVFSGGARTRLDDKHVRAATGDQADEALRVHHLFLQLRDKHLAHSVSPYEDGLLGIAVQDGIHVRGLTPASYRQTIGVDSFKNLWTLCNDLLVVVNELLERSLTVARAEADKLTPEELAALPEAVYIPPGIADLNNKRGGDRVLPEEGAWGYVMTAQYDPDKPDTPEAAIDGPRRRRQALTVLGPHNQQLDWRELGDQADDRRPTLIDPPPWADTGDPPPWA